MGVPTMQNNHQVLVHYPDPATDWDALKADELAIDTALEYVANGRM